MAPCHSRSAARIESPDAGAAAASARSDPGVTRQRPERRRSVRRSRYNEGTLRNVTPVHSGEAVAMLGLVPCRRRQVRTSCTSSHRHPGLHAAVDPDSPHLPSPPSPGPADRNGLRFSHLHTLHVCTCCPPARPPSRPSPGCSLTRAVGAAWPISTGTSQAAPCPVSAASSVSRFKSHPS